jgi:hypothetical protein
MTFAFKKIIPIEGFPFTAMTDWVLCEFLNIQHIFQDEAELEQNIARNNALLKNVVMMIVCIDVRTPLFIVGKPGSSKSLAKTIVSSLMEGKNSKSELFRHLKEKLTLLIFNVHH